MYDPFHDDYVLLDLLKNGDQEAFDQIYQRYWEGLYRTAYQKLRSEEEAKDIIQNVFVWLWEKRETLVITQSLGAYLHSAVRHKVLNSLASQTTRKNRLIQLYRDGVVQADPAGNQSTVQTFYQQEIESLLEQSMGSMPARMQAIFALSRQEQLSSREIAERLNLSEQTVRNQISHALRLVRVYLKDYLVLMLIWFCWR